MDGRLERKVSQSSEANIDQTESWMIDGDAAAALCAITAVADVAALEFSQELRAFGEVHILPFPQRECAHRRGGITPAVFAMAITHLQRVAAHLDLYRSAVTTAFMCLRHGQD